MGRGRPSAGARPKGVPRPHRHPPGSQPAAHRVARREDYVGEWLPEPLLTTPDIADDVELAESVSIAMLTVPETLGPTERAVFVLREVFDTPYEEIAEAIGKSPDAVRQIARRARDHVADRRPRMPVSQAEQQAPERFLLAVRTGHVQQLMEVIAPDVVLIADGGGVVPAARAPIHSAAQVARLLARASRAHTPVTSGVWLNGSPAARVEIGGQMAVVSLVIEAGWLTRIYAMANPDKLTRLDAPAELTR